jgi:hypothetical protein
MKLVDVESEAQERGKVGHNEVQKRGRNDNGKVYHIDDMDDRGKVGERQVLGF